MFINHVYDERVCMAQPRVQWTTFRRSRGAFLHCELISTYSASSGVQASHVCVQPWTDLFPRNDNYEVWLMEINASVSDVFISPSDSLVLFFFAWSIEGVNFFFFLLKLFSMVFLFGFIGIDLIDFWECFNQLNSKLKARGCWGFGLKN